MEPAYECMRSDVQELTFSETASALEGRKNSPHLEELHLTDDMGMYTNFALMLSDQWTCGFTVVSKHFGILYEGTGSILKQLDDVLRILDSMNTRSIMKGRVTAVRKFPKRSVQESIMNAAIHSDMSLGRRTCIEVGYKMMVVSSPGGHSNPSGQPRGFSPIPRNALLAGLLKSLGMVEANRGGLYIIECSYKNTCLTPYIIRNSSQFTVFLPGYIKERKEYDSNKSEVVSFINKSHGATVENVCELLDVNEYFAKRLLDRMEEDDLIFSMRNPGKKTYFPCKASRKGCWDQPERSEPVYISDTNGI